MGFKFNNSDDKNTLSRYGSDLKARQKEQAIRTIIASIKKALRPIPENFGKVFCYDDIVNSARANTYMGDDTEECVDEALRRMQLTEEFPKK